MNKLMTFDRPDIYWDFQLDLESETPYHVSKRIKEYLNNVDTILENIDKEDLTDKEYVELLKKIFYIQISREDEIKILANYYGKEYYRSALMRTSMFKKKENYNPKHRVFRDLYNIIYDVIYTPKVRVYPFNHYTISQIEEYLDDSEMIIVGKKEEEMRSDAKLSLEENYQEYTVHEIGNVLDENNIYFETACAYLRSRLNKQIFMHYVKMYVESIKECLGYLEMHASRERIWEKECALEIQKDLKDSGVLLKLNKYPVNN